MTRKLVFLALFLLFAGFSAGFVPVNAAEEEYGYARVTQENTYLYTQPEAQSGLFILPQSYFVHITGISGEYYAVEYLAGTAGKTAVRGYCRADEVTPVDYIPQTPYLSYTVRVTFRTGEGLPDGFITEYTVGAPFYGTFRFGSSTYYYVELNGAFGYVPATACSLLDYPLNTEHTEVAAPETQPEAQEQTQAGGGLSVAAIVLLCVLGAAGLGLLYFLFRPAHKKRAHEEEAEEFYG